ncbi:MAG: hypothetical protein GX234_04125 [Clostridiales bacterium]|nr:hypothetical protein [Clostridiales bacterium]
MRLSDDFDEKSSGMPVAYMGVIVFLFLLTVFGVVIMMNQKPSGGKKGPEGAAALAETVTDSPESDTDSIQGLTAGGKRRAEDLDFWDMYPEETETETIMETETETETETGPEHDGKHTMIIGEEGKEEWVSINPYLKRNSYDYEGLVYQYPVMKYFENSVQMSHLGVDISKYNGEVDFEKLKKAGVEFVMIRVGARGYGSGQLIQDERFEENMKGASEAGLDIGVYFYSQAISDAEIKEEAQFVMDALEPYDILYPVAYDMELVSNDTARIENLTRDDRTNIAKTFLDTLGAAGYKTVLYGTKEWFLLKLDMTKMTGYDIWLSQEKDVPDYPYQFTMWQYTKSGKVDGIEGNVDMNISFVDYSEK